MKKIYTSYYANTRNLPKEMIPIGISVGKNKWFDGPYDLRLAPTWAMMKKPRAEYDRLFMEQLSKLDARAVYDSLPDNAVLICYEKYNDWCHRRMCAEWLEQELGIEVCEWGLKREESFPYAECCEKNKGIKRVVQKKAEHDPSFVMKEKRQPYERAMNLFDFEY